MSREVDKVIQAVEGYRNIYMLLYIMTIANEDKKQDLLQKYYPHLHRVLGDIPNYIKYQRQDAVTLWPSLAATMEYNLPLIAKPHNIDIEAYVRGLFERNTLVWQDQDWRKYLDFINPGKQVLDYGCGSGFYMTMFRQLTECNLDVWGYDRPEIVEVAKVLHEGLGSNLWAFIMDSKPTAKYDIVWLSEVVHGKDADGIKELMADVKPLVKEDGLVVIQELLPGTALSNLFDVQMKIHCKGKLIEPEDLPNECGIKPKWFRYSEYHYCIGGTIK